MRRSVLLALVSAMVVMLLALPAHAQATRTWVSGVGDDVNPCSRTAPCKTFAGAISQTATAGVINCLDPGGFGAVTITKSITIDCETTVGGVLAAGTNGIVINASGGVVNLVGLDIEGVTSGLIGISVIQAGVVHVKKSRVFGFQGGSATGINMAGPGTLVLDETSVYGNGTGISLNGSGGQVNATLRNVDVHGNSGNGLSITTSARATVDRCTLAFNGGTGLVVNGASVTALIGNCTITGNATGVSVPAGTAYSFKDNQIGGNTTDGTPLAAFPGPGGPLQ